MRLATSIRRLSGLSLLALSAACSGGGGSDAGSVPVTPAATTLDLPASYKLVWADEFDKDGLPDPARWTYDTGMNRQGWYNHEQQYYSANRPENARVQGGRLIITARLESLTTAPDWGGQRYTSARLLTRGLASWTYGFFEVRAKLPCGKGTWPAIWTLGTGGRWPDDGELDILEQVGSRPDIVFSTVHTLAGYGGNGVGKQRTLADACSAFHNYQMHWTANEIVFGVDGQETLRYARSAVPANGWPFAASQFLLLNLAIGGDLGGAVDDSIFPVTYEIEHVRVWQAPA